MTQLLRGSLSRASRRIRQGGSSYNFRIVSQQNYSSTPPRKDEDEGDTAAADAATRAKAKEEAALLRKAASDFNSRRASYKRKVGKLRASYYKEHQEYQKQDTAAQDAAVAATTRRRLERQRAKNERSFRNAIRQEELRRQTQLAFADHLREQQKIRESKEALHQRARQLLVDDLEQEAHLWLTTPEEVHAAFDDPNNEQDLWGRSQGTLGVPNPSLDSHFWSYEGHTWDRSKTYKTRSEILLEELEHEAYVKTNVDFDNHWTPEKISEREALEEKAKLRSNVRQAGRRALLQRQKEYLHEEEETEEGEPPKPRPIPSLSVLGNIQAQEKEGAEVLLKDPTKFFVFDGTNDISEEDGDETQNTDQTTIDTSYSGSSLGVPIGLRDPLRTGKPQGRVYPIPIGKLPKPDMRTEKEKKREEREERLWAAANKKQMEEDDELALVPEEDREIGEAVDYEEAYANWDSDDEEWEKGLDPNNEAHKEMLAVPRELRYTDEDLDQAIERLEAKAQAMQNHVRNTINTMEQEARSRLVDSDGDDKPKDDSPFFDEATAQKLKDVGADVDKYEKLLASLSQEQLLAMFALEAQDIQTTEDGDTTSTKVFESIEGLTESQIEGLTELESFIAVAEQSTS